MKETGIHILKDQNEEMIKYTQRHLSKCLVYKDLEIKLETKSHINHSSVLMKRENPTNYSPVYRSQLFSIFMSLTYHW